MSLRNQISIRILLISLCILLIGGSMSLWQARKAVNKEVDSSINLALQLIELGFDKNKIHATDWISRLSHLEQTRHLTIQLKNNSGQLININRQTIPTKLNNPPPDWFTNLVTSSYPQVEHQLKTLKNTDLTLIIQANPMDEIAEVWDETIAFLTTLLLLALVSFISIHLVFNKAFSSIQLIVEHLKSIETGSYQNKLPVFSTREYADIANAINHMTDALNSTQQQNKALTQHSLAIQEEERQHLSQELHDEFGQSLTAIKVMAVTAGHEKSDTHKITVSIVEICDHLMTVLRSMMKQLHPLMLTELGLKATLEDLVQHWNARTPHTTFQLLCSETVDQLTPSIAIQMFRVIQESLTNTVRHANATNVSVTLDIQLKTNMLTLSIIDDGRGFHVNDVVSGFGLLGMEERINLLGGIFEIQTQVNKGTQINVQLPL